MDPSRVAAMIEEGRSQLRSCADLYGKQIAAGRHFLPENPASAVSSREPYTDALTKHHRLFTAVCDQCQFGLTTKSADGLGCDLAMKPTRFLMSSQPMAEGLGRTCDRSPKHQHLAGGRGAEATFYHIPVITAILKDMMATTVSELRHQSARTA